MSNMQQGCWKTFRGGAATSTRLAVKQLIIYQRFT